MSLSRDNVPRHPAWERVFPWPKDERSFDRVNQWIREHMRLCIDQQRPWPLVMIGPPGIGKTLAALCLCDHVASSEYFTVPGLCRRINLASFKGLEWRDEKTGTSGTFREDEVWRMIGKAPLVVLDELGVREKISDAHYETVKQVLDERGANPLIVVSNVSMDDIGRLYDARMVSRLSAGTVLELSGRDRRPE